MKRKSKKEKISYNFVKYIVIALFVVGLSYFLGQEMVTQIKRSDIFKIRTIMIDPSSPFIKSDELIQLKGKNIFNLDCEALQNRLRMRYPELSQLKIVKRLPDQLLVKGKRRNAFAQAQIRSRHVTVDQEGIVLSEMGDADQELPLIRGVKANRVRIKNGFAIETVDLQMALRIIKAFRENATLKEHLIRQIEVDNLSKINLHTISKIHIIMDKERINEKLKMLEVVLSQGTIDFGTIKYVDIRFKEPILGKK